MEAGLHWLLTATIALIVLGSLLPGGLPLVGAVPSVITNIAHVPAYSLLAYCALATVEPVCRRSVTKVCLVVILLAMTLGIGVELIQLIVARSASLIDVALNLVGAVAGVLAWLMFARRRGREQSPDSG